MGFFDRFRTGIQKSSANFGQKLKGVFSRHPKLDEEFYEELEAIFLGADLGLPTTLEVIDDLKEKVREERVGDVDEARELITTDLINILKTVTPIDLTTLSKKVILLIGVNGTGKTTTIAKLTAHLKTAGKSVTLVAGDTFRAAAVEQLSVWAERLGVEIIKQDRGADPAAVVFDAITSFKGKPTDILLVDTAGRLHTHSHLLDELKKIKRIADREIGEENVVTLIALDATIGQNALSQVKYFNEAAKIDGIVLTKLDGTAKGGIVFPIIKELNVPVCYIGFGEQLDDLGKFDPAEFVAGIMENELSEGEES